MRLRNIAWVLVSFVLVAVASFAQTSGRLPLNPMTHELGPGSNPNYGKLPLVFETNRGQADPQARFLARGKGYTAFLTSDGMVLSLRPTNVEPIPRTGNVPATSDVPSVPPTAVQFRLSGAIKNPAVVGEDQKLGRVNYFFGKDPTKWRTNVPTYARVRYRNVYPGIDLVYYGTGRQLECDFAVSPGANPNRIQFEITGAKEIRVDPLGNLVLKTNSGELAFEIPVVYQESNGQRVVVDGAYVVNDPTHFSFHVAHYDPEKPLVIDPVLVYSTYLGGSGFDQPAGIAVDSSGSVYVAGYTDSPDFPLAPLGSLPTGTNHVFVAKLDPSGSNLMYADYLGGSVSENGYALALDGANEVYVTGSTQSPDFPTVNPYQASLLGSSNGFVTRISADGSSLLYSTYLGGDGYDQPSGIGINTLGEVYVAGMTTSQNFPVVNANQPTVSPNQVGMYGIYGFVTKFTTDGSTLVYSTFLGGNSNVAQTCNQSPCWPVPWNIIYGIAVDANDNAYVTGNTGTYNFPTTPGAYLTTDSAPLDALVGFVSKFSSSGNLDYSTYLYGTSGAAVQISSIAVDSSGSAYVTGNTASDGTFPITSTSICDPGISYGGCSYAFVTKFDPTGSTLQYSTFLGLYNSAFPQALVLDRNNDAYVLSATWSGTFAIPNGIEPYTNGADLMVAEIDPVASTQLFATFLGASGDDYPAGLALDSGGNLYVAGYTNSTDFPVTQGAFQDTIGGSFDALVVKVGPNSEPAVSVSPFLLQYSSQAIGLGSQPQTALLRNMGSSPLSISSVTVGGDFAETDNCGTSVSAAASCTFSVTFTPTAVGPRSGSIQILDDAAGSPHVINLSGNGSGAVAAVNPTSLAFSAQPLGTSSVPQNGNLTNAGNVTLDLGNIQVAGDFSQTNNCPAILAPNSSCTLSVSFAPTVTGARNGTLTISDNAQGSPQTVILTGMGSTAPAPVATLTPTNLAFPGQQVGSSSAAQTITLTNTGNATLNLGGIQISGNYAQTNTCPATLAASSSCAINVMFTPSAPGSRNGVLTISDNAQGSPQIATLTGTGSTAPAPIATVTPTNVVFPSQQVGTTSAAQTVTLTNTGNATLHVSGIQITGGYTQTNTCPATLAANSSCTINVTFTPSASGTRSGTLTMSDNAQGSPQIVNLAGAGADFTLASSPSSDSLKAGATATYQVAVSPVGGAFTNVVKLNCTGAPSLTTCKVSPNAVTPNGSAATSTLTITTTPSVAQAVLHRSSRDQMIYVIWMPGIGLFGMILVGSRARSRKIRVIILLSLMTAGLVLMIGCAGGTGVTTPPPTGTAPGTYTITVTGTAGTLQHSLPLILTVQ